MCVCVCSGGVGMGVYVEVRTVSVSFFMGSGDLTQLAMFHDKCLLKILF